MVADLHIRKVGSWIPAFLIYRGNDLNTKQKENQMKSNENEKSTVESDKKECVGRASKYINRQYDKSLRMLSEQGEGASSKDFK